MLRDRICVQPISCKRKNLPPYSPSFETMFHVIMLGWPSAVGTRELQNQTQNLIHGFLGLERATALGASEAMFRIVMLNICRCWGAARTRFKHEPDPWTPQYQTRDRTHCIRNNCVLHYNAKKSSACEDRTREGALWEPGPSTSDP